MPPNKPKFKIGDTVTIEGGQGAIYEVMSVPWTTPPDRVNYTVQMIVSSDGEDVRNMFAAVATREMGMNEVTKQKYRAVSNEPGRSGDFRVDAYTKAHAEKILLEELRPE